MFRQIVTPSNTQLTLQIPVEFVGHLVEVIAFTVENQENTITGKPSLDQRMNRLAAYINSNPINLPEDYKFNRDELYE